MSVTLYNTVIAIGTIALQLFLLALIVATIIKAPLGRFVLRYSGSILRIIFTGAVIGSLIYSEYFGYAPCLLCWYQRLAIFPIAILLWTGDIATTRLLRIQILVFSSLGLLVALFHNYIDIFQPNGVGVCSTSGVSCLVRYVYAFNFITIPMMSATVLFSGVLLAFLLSSYPQNKVA